MQRVLIAGATGRLGQPVARHLKAAGFEVRALVRDPFRCDGLRRAGIELVVGDVTRPETLPAACDGRDALYISLRGQNTIASYDRCEVQGVVNLIDAAQTSGIRRIAYLSGAGRVAGNENHFPARVKAACEAAIQAGAVPYSIFRATHFMESLPMFVRGKVAEVLGSQPHRYHYVALQDYARMLANALGNPDAANKVFTILGPESFTMHEALRVYLAQAHPGMRVRTAPLPLLRFIAALTRNQDLTFATQLFAAFAALGEEGDPTLANEMLGAPQTTLEQWSARFSKQGAE